MCNHAQPQFNFSSQSLSWNLELTSLAGQGSQQAPGSLLSLSSGGIMDTSIKWMLGYGSSLHAWMVSTLQTESSHNPPFLVTPPLRSQVYYVAQASPELALLPLRFQVCVCHHV